MFSDKEKEEDCLSCAVGKTQRQQMVSKNDKYLDDLEIYADIAGPFNVSKAGARYLLLFKDRN